VIATAIADAAAATAIAVAITLWTELGMTGHVAVAHQAQTLIGSVAHLAATTGATATGHVAAVAHGGSALHAGMLTAKGATVGAKAGFGLGAKLAIAGVATVAVGGGSFVAVHALTAAKAPPAAVASVAPLTGGQLATALLPQSAFPSGNAPIGNLVYSGDGRTMNGVENAGTSSCDNLMPEVGFTGYVYKVGQTAFAGQWTGGDTEGSDPGYASEFLQEVLQFDSAATADTYYQQIRTRMIGCDGNGGFAMAEKINGNTAITSQYRKTVQTSPTNVDFEDTVQPLMVRDNKDIIVVAAEEGRNRIDFSSLSDLLPSLATKLVTDVDRANAHPGPAYTSTPTQPPTTTTPPPTTTTTPSGPAGVLQNYIAAINGHDYQTAWAIGGPSTRQSYTAFVQGFASTDHDVLTIDSVQGGSVVADVTAYQTDGTQHTYHGTYTISDNTITNATVQQTG
jgi:hypothetical protein